MYPCFTSVEQGTVSLGYNTVQMQRISVRFYEIGSIVNSIYGVYIQ